MGSRLFAATTSQGKLRDFRTAAATYSVAIDTVPGMERIAVPEENGTTFLANASLKAIYYSKFVPDETVLADDSGLEVDALSGAPGVRSARFAADAAAAGHRGPTDGEYDNMLLIKKMAAFRRSCARRATAACSPAREMGPSTRRRRVQWKA